MDTEKLRAKGYSLEKIVSILINKKSMHNQEKQFIIDLVKDLDVKAKKLDEISSGAIEIYRSQNDDLGLLEIGELTARVLQYI